MHGYPLITTLAAAFTAAWALGLVTQRIGLSPIVGYLLAGVLIGPYTPGFVGDVELAPQLAELGVILLMFGVGLHFQLKDLLAVKFIAIPGAIGQSLAATLTGAVVFSVLGWPLTTGLVLGMAMAVASTVVLIRVLTDNQQLNTHSGHAAVGWLIVEDLITVVILVLIPALAGAAAASGVDAAAGNTAGAVSGGTSVGDWLISLGIALGKLALMVVVLLFAGSKVVPWVLVQVARLRSRELFTLTVLVLSIAVATGAAVMFGASVALGAFLAGMVVAQSPVSQQAGIDALPMRDAFAVLFFVAVGMLFNPWFPVEQPLLLLAGLSIVFIAKPAAALIIVAVLGYPARTALTIAIALAQIGEFSFIVGELAYQHGLLPEMGHHLLVACALVSITLNPILFRAIGPMETWLRRWPLLWRLLNGRSERRADRGNAPAIEHVAAVEGPLAVVVGYGPVGRQVDRLLRQAGMETIVVDLNMDTITDLATEGRSAIFGDATRVELLDQAGIRKATHLVLTAPHSSGRHALITAAKGLNPSLRLLVRTRYMSEEADARQQGADTAVADEVESAVALAEMVLAEMDADGSRILAETDRIRQELSARHRPSVT